MRIKRIIVERLFGVFDHDIPLNRDDRITIIYGPNGFGKTYTLMLVNELFNPGFGDFFRIPFRRVAAVLEDDSTLSVKRDEKDGSAKLLFEYGKPGASPQSFEFGDMEEKLSREPAWLRKLKKDVGVDLIHTERLIEITDNDWSTMTETVLRCSKTFKKRCDLLTEIVNARFVHKRMTIDERDGIVFTTADGKKLGPEHLSSGERHILLVLFRLLYIVNPDSLILLDEPELSLHIVWQQQLLVDLEKIIRLTGVDILVATHSPQIIHDRWDLAVELKDPGA